MKPKDVRAVLEAHAPRKTFASPSGRRTYENRTYLDQLFPTRLSVQKKNRPPRGGRFSFRASQDQSLVGPNG
jgi:hypothetical protein